jgi:hypothetical protein
MLAEAGFNFFPIGPDIWVRLILFKFAVKHGFLIRVDGRASKQVPFVDFANSLQNFAAICVPQLGQFIKNSQFAHGMKLVLVFGIGKGNSGQTHLNCWMLLMRATRRGSLHARVRALSGSRRSVKVNIGQSVLGRFMISRHVWTLGSSAQGSLLIKPSNPFTKTIDPAPVPLNNAVD